MSADDFGVNYYRRPPRYPDWERHCRALLHNHGRPRGESPPREMIIRERERERLPKVSYHHHIHYHNHKRRHHDHGTSSSSSSSRHDSVAMTCGSGCGGCSHCHPLPPCGGLHHCDTTTMCHHHPHLHHHHHHAHGGIPASALPPPYGYQPQQYQQYLPPRLAQGPYGPPMPGVILPRAKVGRVPHGYLRASM